MTDYVIVHVRGVPGGTEGGTVELDIDYGKLQPLLEDAEGNPIMPDDYCGLRIYHAHKFWWEDADGLRVDDEHHGEVLKLDHDSFYDGIEFRGPITACGATHAKPNDNPWYFPTPLTLTGTPQFDLGAVKLVIELRETARVEFIDNGMKPMKFPDLYKKHPKSEDLVKMVLKFLETIFGEKGKSEAMDELGAICDWYPEACETEEFTDWIDEWLPEYRDTTIDQLPKHPPQRKRPAERSAPLNLPSIESVRYTGVFRAGTDGHALWVGDTWGGFEKKWKELSKDGLRLIDIETWMDGKTRRYAGVFREGTGGHALWVNDDWKGFGEKWQELSKNNLRLIDIEIVTPK